MSIGYGNYKEIGNLSKSNFSGRAGAEAIAEPLVKEKQDGRGSEAQVQVAGAERTCPLGLRGVITG